MRFVIAILVLIFVAGTWAACASDPDGTHETLFYQDCNPNQPLVVNKIVLTHDDGSDNYPLDVIHPVDIWLNITNTATTSFYNIVYSGSIARYTDIFGFCSWIGVPTFGLLDNLDGCVFGSTRICPLRPGISILHDRIDLASYSLITNLLSTSEPYRLSLSYKSGNVEIACVTLEAIITKL